MNTEQKDLWGEFPNIDDLETPLAILRKQISFLETKSRGLLVGRAVTGEISGYRPPANDERIDGEREILQAIDFFIVVPSLNDYSYRLLRVAQPIWIYPLKIYVYYNAETKECQSIDEFKVALGDILSSKETKKILANLLAQAVGTSHHDDLPF